MTSSHPVLQKLANSFLAKKVQNSPLSKMVSSLFPRQQPKNKLPEKPQASNFAHEKTANNHHVYAKDVKSHTPFENDQITYIINNKFFDNFQKEEDTEIYIIYLNRPFDIETLQNLHKISSYTIMADGAANRFYDKFTTITQQHEIVPHALVGDFDSIRTDVLKYYKEKQVKVFHDQSQDDSDLEKCLKHLQKKLQEEQTHPKEKFYRILITGGFGGRMDHTLNNIHILHKFAEKYTKQGNVFFHLIDNNSIGTCILPGKTKYFRSKCFEQDAGCGIFPLLGEQARVHTKGLKWNVGPDSPALSFKKFVSSSNEMIDDVIEFETDKIIFWTTTNSIHGKRSED